VDLKTVFFNILELNRELGIIMGEDNEIILELDKENYERALFILIIRFIYEIELSSYRLLSNRKKTFIIRLLMLLEKLYLVNTTINNAIHEYISILVRYANILRENSLKFKDSKKWKELLTKIQNIISSLQ
jgi:hypothetical protein